MHIAIDMDNTLGDTTTAGVEWLNRMLDGSVRVAEAPPYAFFEAFGLNEDMYWKLYLQDGEDLHWHTTPYPDAAAVVTALMATHRVSIVTARPACFEAVSRRWMAHHGLPVQALHHEYHKYDWCVANDVDLLIEDAPHYAREFAAKGRPLMLMDHPYNRHCDHDLITRVNDWQAIRRHFDV